MRVYRYLEIDVAQKLALKVEPGGPEILTYQLALISNGRAVPSPRFTLCPAISTISLNELATIPGFSKIRTIDDYRWFSVKIPAGLYMLEVTGTTSDNSGTLSYAFDLFERFGEHSQFEKIGHHVNNVSQKGPVATNAYKITTKYDSAIWIRAKDANAIVDLEFKLRPL